MNGIVKRTDFGNITVDLGRAEGVIRRDESIPRDCCGLETERDIYDVREEPAARKFFCLKAPPVHGQALRSGSAGNL